MRFAKVDGNDKAIVDKTKSLLRKRKSKISSVSAGLRTNKGTEYYGLSVELNNSTMGMCAEHSAIGAMVSNGERRVQTVVTVALTKGKYYVLPPCGRCREFLQAFGDPYVIIQTGRDPNDLKKVRLSKLLPFNWWQFWESFERNQK